MFLGAFLTFYVPERVCLVHNSASETLENTVGFQLFQVVAILLYFFPHSFLPVCLSYSEIACLTTLGLPWKPELKQGLPFTSPA